MFIKTFTLMLLHPRANLADQEQNHRILICVPWPLSAIQAAKITFSSVKHRTLQSIKKGYRTSGILARGYRRKDLLTHYFHLEHWFFLRNYLRGSKPTTIKQNTCLINILQVTWWRFPVLMINSPKLVPFTDVHNYALRLLHMFSYNRKHIHCDRNFSPGNKNVNCT